MICTIKKQLDDKTCSLVWTTSYEEANRLTELSDNEFIDALNDSLSVHFKIVKCITINCFINYYLWIRKKKNQTIVAYY